MREAAAGRPACARPSHAAPASRPLLTCTDAVLACWHCIALPFPFAAGCWQQQRHQVAGAHQQPELAAPAGDPAAEPRLRRCGGRGRVAPPGPGLPQPGWLGAHAWRPVRTFRGPLCTLLWHLPLPHLPASPANHPCWLAVQAEPMRRLCRQTGATWLWPARTACCECMPTPAAGRWRGSRAIVAACCAAAGARMGATWRRGARMTCWQCMAWRVGMPPQHCCVLCTVCCVLCAAACAKGRMAAGPDAASDTHAHLLQNCGPRCVLTAME